MGEGRLGRIVVLDGAPRSGKASIAAAIQGAFDGVWMNLGVDVFHAHEIYGVEFDTAVSSPEGCAAAIGRALRDGVGRPTAFEQLAGSC